MSYVVHIVAMNVAFFFRQKSKSHNLKKMMASDENEKQTVQRGNAAAWAWYQHSSGGAEARRIPRVRTDATSTCVTVPGASRFRHEALKESVLRDVLAVKAVALTHSDSAPFDRHNLAVVAQHLDIKVLSTKNSSLHVKARKRSSRVLCFSDRVAVTDQDDKLQKRKPIPANHKHQTPRSSLRRLSKVLQSLTQGITQVNPRDRNVYKLHGQHSGIFSRSQPQPKRNYHRQK